MRKCINCGGELLTGDCSPSGICNGCISILGIPKLHEKIVSKNYGWICPVCGRGNAPFTSTCPCMPYPRGEITC